MTSINDYTRQVLALGRQYSLDVAAVRQATPDPDLTPEARGRVMAEKLDALRASLDGAIAAVAAQVQTEHARLKSAGDAQRPKVDANDAAALVRTEQAWVHNVRPALEAGRSLHEVLATATLDDALGLERFGASYLTNIGGVRRGSGVTAEEVSGYQVVAESLARHAGGAAGEAVLAAHGADEGQARFKRVAAYVRTGDLMGAAIEAGPDDH